MSFTHSKYLVYLGDKKTSKDIIRQLRTRGSKVKVDDVLAQFFLSVSDKYLPLIRALLNVDSRQLILNMVKQRSISEESKLSEHTDEDNEGKALFYGKKNFK